MKVFVLCITILLAAAVNSSPVDVEEVVLDNGAVQVQVFDSVQANPEEQEVNEVQEPAVDESFQPDNEIVEKEMIDEPLVNKVAVQSEENNEEKSIVDEDADGEPFLIEDDYDDLTDEEKEVILGIEIPLCSQYTNDRIALHLSHLEDCTRFYKCYNGRGFLMTCPAGEHWSVLLDRCDYPEKAKCRPNGTHQYRIRKIKPLQASAVDVEEQPDDKPELGEFEIDPRCEGSDPFKPLHFKHVSDCTKFYKCYMGKAYVIKCPKGQHWSQSLNRCEHASIARCAITRPVNVRPAQFVVEESEEQVFDEDFVIIDERCKQAPEDINHPIEFPHPTDCGKFYMCHGLVAYKFPCPAKLHFNALTNECDYIRRAHCATGILAAQAIEEVDDDDENEYVFDEDFKIVDSRCTEREVVDIYHPIEFAHPTDCGKFYMCHGSTAYKMSCPARLHFNVKTNDCDHPKKARCATAVAAHAIEEFVPYEIEYKPNRLESDPDYMILDSRCATKETDIYHPIQFVHPTDCNKYYVCMNNKAYKQECQFGLYFNEQEQYCDYPWHTTCTSKITPYVQANIPNIPKCNHNENLPVEGVPNQYLLCRNGETFLMECEMRELFNPETGKCEAPNFPPEVIQHLPELFYQYPQFMNQFPELMTMYANSHPGMQHFPGMMNQYPGFVQTFPQNLAPFVPQIPFNPSVPQQPQPPVVYQPQPPVVNQPQPPVVNQPQPPAFNQPQPPVFNQPQAPLIDLPSWLPVQKPNIQIPSMPLPPSDNKRTNDFNYQNGKTNSRCPTSDEPMKPVHLVHETECGKFYKCYNGRAFIMDCPSAQEWSEELQRCDYHQFAKCDPVELIKRKIQK